MKATRSQPVSLAEHLKGFSAVELSIDALLPTMKTWLGRHGPIQHCQLSDASVALQFLLPIKSFTTHYVLVGLGKWSLVVCDMRGECCYVDAYAASRSTGCRGIGVFLQQERRELHVFEKGEQIRVVQSLRDGDRWYYREDGLPQPFEDAAELRRQTKDRLGVSILAHYFETYTGMKLPSWTTIKSTQFHGLERSIAEVRVPIVKFETINDV